MVSSVSDEHLALGDGGVVLELLASAASSMSMLTTVGGRKLPRSTRIAFLRSTSLGCST